MYSTIRCMGLECRKGALRGYKAGRRQAVCANQQRQRHNCLPAHTQAPTVPVGHSGLATVGSLGPPFATLQKPDTHLNPTMELSGMPTHCASLVRATAMRSRIVIWSSPARVAPVSVKSATSNPAPYSLLTRVQTAGGDGGRVGGGGMVTLPGDKETAQARQRAAT